MVGVASRRTRGQTSSQRTVIAQVGGFQLEPLAALSQLPSRFGSLHLPGIIT